jgi:hypothetical protein
VIQSRKYGHVMYSIYIINEKTHQVYDNIHNITAKELEDKIKILRNLYDKPPEKHWIVTVPQTYKNLRKK